MSNAAEAVEGRSDSGTSITTRSRDGGSGEEGLDTGSAAVAADHEAASTVTSCHGFAMICVHDSAP